MSQFIKDTLTYSTLLFKRDDDKCKGDSQKCEKPAVMTTGELVVAIVIPIVVVACLLVAFTIRAYKINKKEDIEFRNDPEFYKNDEEFISANDMPIAPPPAYNHNMINNDSVENISLRDSAMYSGSLRPPYMNDDRNSTGGLKSSSTGNLNPFSDNNNSVAYNPTSSTVNLTQGHH